MDQAIADVEMSDADFEEFTRKREPVLQKTVIFAISEKGGVGKTTFCRGWLDIARGRGNRVAAYDADGTVGQLLRFYGTRKAGSTEECAEVQDPLVGVGYFSVRNEAQRDTLLNIANSTMEADYLIVDLPGGSTNDVRQILGNTRLLIDDYVAAGWRVIIAVVIDHLKTAPVMVVNAPLLFGPHCEYVVVKNCSGADPDDFLAYEGYETMSGEMKYGKAKQVMEKVGGSVVAMPKLAGRTYGLIDMENLTFSQAAVDGGRLMKADSSRTAGWLRTFAANMRGTPIDPPERG